MDGNGEITLVPKPIVDNTNKNDTIDRYYKKMFKKDSYKFLNDLQIPFKEEITTTKTLTFNEIIKNDGVMKKLGRRLPTRGNLINRKPFNTNKGSLDPVIEEVKLKGCFSPVIGQNETRGVFSPKIETQQNMTHH